MTGGVCESSAESQSLTTGSTWFARAREHVSGVYLGVCVVGYGAASLILGQDANWDLRNYHLYVPFSVVQKRILFDLAPAQRQSYHPPTLDFPYYGLISTLNDYPRVVAVLWSLPNAVAAWLTFLLARRLLRPVNRAEWLELGLALLIGVTGAAVGPTIGSTMSEAIPAALLIGSLLVVLEGLRSDAERPGGRAMAGWLLAAGGLAGCAVGFKLTSTSLLAGLGLSILLFASSMRSRLIGAASFAAGGLVGIAASAGYWFLTVWHTFRNPLFPYFNQLFRSPWYPAIDLSDRRFAPRGLLETVFRPFYWAIQGEGRIAEVGFRDPRFALVMAATLAAIVVFLLRRRSSASSQPAFHRDQRVFLVAFAVSYLLWLKQFSILRYLAPTELVIGLALVVLVRQLLPQARKRLPALAGATVACLALTSYPSWGRTPFGPRAIDTTFPPIPPQSLVVLLDGNPMAHVALAAPRDARFVAPNSNLSNPETQGLLQQEMNRVIASHPGPLYGLDMQNGNHSTAEATLQQYRLLRDEASCRPVVSNISIEGTVRVCPLRRMP